MSALIPLALTLTPDLARWLSGSNAAAVASSIEQAIAATTSVSGAEAVAAALQQDPALAATLRVQLAKIAADLDDAAVQAHFADLAAAVRSAASGNPAIATALAWSAPIVSAAVLLTFGVVMAMVLVFGMRPGSETTSNMLLGTLAAMATSVVSYWVGSSAGSARKDDRLAQLTK